MTTRTEIRAIPEQWEHLLQRLKESRMLDGYIQIAHSKC